MPWRHSHRCGYVESQSFTGACLVRCMLFLSVLVPVIGLSQSMCIAVVHHYLSRLAVVRRTRLGVRRFVDDAVSTVHCLVYTAVHRVYNERLGGCQRPDHRAPTRAVRRHTVDSVDVATDSVMLASLCRRLHFRIIPSFAPHSNICSLAEILRWA